jgi:hypothetical protein
MQQQYKLSQLEKLVVMKPTSPDKLTKCERAVNTVVFENTPAKRTKSPVNSTKYMRTPTKGGASLPFTTPKSQVANLFGISIEANKSQTLNDVVIFKPTVKPDQIECNKTVEVGINEDLKDRYKLKNCTVSLDRFNVSLLKKGVFTLNDKKTKTKKKEEILMDIKKFRVKSKTFPYASSQVAVESLEDIVSVGSSTSISTSTSITNRKRTSSRSLKLIRTSSFNYYPLIQSPAELLRKYATVKGHVCEMDKIFKGSSITLTQCLECENLRKSPEAFYDRSLPINTNFNGA